MDNVYIDIYNIYITEEYINKENRKERGFVFRDIVTRVYLSLYIYVDR